MSAAKSGGRARPRARGPLYVIEHFDGMFGSPLSWEDALTYVQLTTRRFRGELRPVRVWEMRTLDAD